MAAQPATRPNTFRRFQRHLFTRERWNQIYNNVIADLLAAAIVAVLGVVTGVIPITQHAWLKIGGRIAYVLVTVSLLLWALIRIANWLDDRGWSRVVPAQGPVEATGKPPLALRSWRQTPRQFVLFTGLAALGSIVFFSATAAAYIALWPKY